MAKVFMAVILILLLNAGISFAQQQELKIPRQIFTRVEELPTFPGGTVALKKFLSRHIRYPKSAYKKDIEGTVYVRFVVETDGSVSSPEIVHGLDPDCDRETLRVIGKMPRWNPGRQNGSAAAVYYHLPVSFKLE